MKFSTSALLVITSFVASSAQNIGDDLKQAAVFQSDENGLLDITLTLEYADHATAAHSFTNTRLFNGTLPGPTLKVKAGDTMRILFKNQLVDQGHDYEENTYSYPDTSNLHFRGAHVSGELPSDDVTYKVEPQAAYQYETGFPYDHMPGTHWIHPHLHGAGALQVGGGAAMALIVEDPAGTLPEEVENAEDVLLFVQHMDINELESIATASSDGYLEVNNNNIHGRNYRLVNGQYQPTVHMQPGEWQRWRVVYAGWLRDPLDFTIVDHINNGCEMQLLAKDGLYIQDFPRVITMAPIPSAGRADIMVRCPNPGDFVVSDFGGGTLLHIKVEGTTILSGDLPPLTNVATPEYLLSLTNTPASNDCTCSTRFQSNDACEGGNHCVNGLPFESHRFLHQVVLGQVVERQLRGVNAHPYHQHVYPFQIVDGVHELTGDHSAYFQTGDWHDVIMIDEIAAQNAITMRYYPTVHLGRLMLHCHRLDHEDQGMMAQEDVLASGTCQCDANTERSDPTLSPVQSPTTLAPVVACVDDETWSFLDRNGSTIDCTDVQDRILRCTNISEAAENCPATCGTCTTSTPAPISVPTPVPVTPAPVTSVPSAGPSAVPSSRPSSTPSLRPSSGPSQSLVEAPTTPAPVASTSTPAPVTTCADDMDWSTIDRQGNTITCTDVQARTQRCTNVPDAADNCPATCGVCTTTSPTTPAPATPVPAVTPAPVTTLVPSAAPSSRPSSSHRPSQLRGTPSPVTTSTPSSCEDSTTWLVTLRSGSTIGCDRTPSRTTACDLEGTDGVLGRDACPLSCGECVP